MQAAATALVNGAEHAIAVYAPVLLPALFNNSGYVRALAQFAARHRRNTVQFLFDDAQQALRDNDRLAGACRRLRDAIRWHQVADEDRGGGDLFIVADGRTCVHLPDRTRNDGEWAETTDTLPMELRRRFNAMWDRSQPTLALSPVGL